MWLRLNNNNNCNQRCAWQEQKDIKILEKSFFAFFAGKRFSRSVILVPEISLFPLSQKYFYVFFFCHGDKLQILYIPPSQNTHTHTHKHTQTHTHAHALPLFLSFAFANLYFTSWYKWFEFLFVTNIRSSYSALSFEE